jgi:integrase/recombinase XerD
MNVSVNLVLNMDREKANGKYPVKLRVIFNRQRKDFVTKIDLTEQEFTEAIKSNPRKQYRVVANELVAIKDKANQIIKQLPQFTFSKFEHSFLGSYKDASDIYPFFEDYIKSLEEEDRYKTAVAYRTAMNAFKQFHKGKLNLYDITDQFMARFQKDMVAKGKSLTTVGIYARALRTIFNLCINKGIIKKEDNYPFGRGRYIIPAGRNTKKALNLVEIGKIARYETFPGSYMDRARDFWMLSYYLGGINFKDLLLLRNKNIDKDMLRYVREKTKKTAQGNQTPISAYISDDAMRIINKWRSKTKGKDDLIFPFVSASDNTKERYAVIEQFIQNTNKNLKRICEALKIERNVTTYYSRHSAATVLKRSGASVNQIQEMLGHSNVTVTQKYLDSFEDETKRELARALNNL